MSYAGSIIAFPATPEASRVVFFKQRELTLILNTYGRMVGAGLVRDYAICENRGQVTFSFFQRASERPTYKVVKSVCRGNYSFSILGSNGGMLKKGHSLKNLLKYFDPKMIRLINA